VKVARTVESARRLSVQTPEPEQAPLQPSNVEPAEGVAVSVSEVPSGKVAVQVAPQSIAAGPDRTEPPPEMTTLSVCVGGAALPLSVSVGPPHATISGSDAMAINTRIFREASLAHFSWSTIAIPLGTLSTASPLFREKTRHTFRTRHPDLRSRRDRPHDSAGNPGSLDCRVRRRAKQALASRPRDQCVTRPPEWAAGPRHARRPAPKRLVDARGPWRNDSWT